MPFRRLRSPFLWSVALLLSSLGLVVTLAWQALSAERSHRESTVGVLLDFAALAAGEMARRSMPAIGYNGYYPVMLSLKQANGEALAAPADLAEGDERVAKAAELVATTFRRDSAGSLETRGATLGDEARRRLSQLAAESVPADGAFQVVHAVIAGRLRTFVWTPTDRTEHGRIASFSGFEVDREALASWLEAAAERAPLLPASLLDESDGPSSSGVSVRMIDPLGDEVFSTSAARGPVDSGELYLPRLTAEHVFDDSYSGIFSGHRLEAAIDPSMAPRLVPGGMPRSRLPLLAALTLLAAALGVGAFLQVQRERALARMRSDFVARVSHELRTPLAQIRLFAETLRLDRTRSERERRHALEVIDRESARLAGLVDNVLRFSRAERRLDRLHLENQDLAQLLREIVRDLAPLVEGRGVSLSLEVPDGPLPVRVDRDALRQIVLNLLENAVEHGGSPQTVRLTLDTGAGDGADGASPSAGFARLRVEDEGPGVAAGDRERIFEPYVRGADTGGGRGGAGGAGIGLSVVRDLAERLGGKVRCAPDAGRAGARFEVSLPVAESVT